VRHACGGRLIIFLFPWTGTHFKSPSIEALLQPKKEKILLSLARIFDDLQRRFLVKMRIKASLQYPSVHWRHNTEIIFSNYADENLFICILKRLLQETYSRNLTHSSNHVQRKTE